MRIPNPSRLHTRWAFFALLVAPGIICLTVAFRIGAATPMTGTIMPASAPLTWDGAAAGGTSNGEATCTEGVNCDTFTLTVTGTPADWAGKVIRVDITWVALASDYDFYIHKGDNAGPIIAQGATGPPSTSETADIEPGDLDADGSTVFSIRTVYFAATAGDQYNGMARSVSVDAPPAPPPATLSKNWNIVYHGTCCEGNLTAAGDNTFVLLPVLVTGNIIKKSSDGGKTWTQKYPPAPASVPFGIEGDMQAFGDDVIFFGTELAAVVVAHSDDKGETFTAMQVPVASGGNDQTWSYLGPFSDLAPAGQIQTEPYVLAGWFRIGTAVVFSFDGGRTFPIQTPLAGNNGSGPEHVVCQRNAVEAPASPPADTRVPHPLFTNFKGGRHGTWGTDRKFYWTETAGESLYVCQTDDFGVEWTGTKHPLADGPGKSFVVTHAAFDENGTLYVLHGNKLYVSFNQGKSFAFTHTLPRYGNAGRSDSGSDQYLAVDCGTVHIALLEDGGNGKGNVFYLRGTRADTAMPTWDQELVDVTDFVRLDFMQIVLNGNDIPTISYTTPDVPGPPVQQRDVTTASRNAPMPSLSTGTCGITSATAVSRKVHGTAGTFDLPLPLDGPAGVEPRNQANTHQVVFKFGVPVTFGTASVLPGTGGTAELDGLPTFNPATNEVTVNLKNVSNAQILKVSLADVNGGGASMPVSVEMGVLHADATSSRRVDAADVQVVREQNLQTLQNTNFRDDVNASGRIDSGDVLITRQRNLTELPANSAAKAPAEHKSPEGTRTQSTSEEKRR